jgi:hypothetical protein
MPAILIETCFCDSDYDVRTFNDHYDKLVIAIADALSPKPSLLSVEDTNDDDLLVDGRGGKVC